MKKKSTSSKKPVSPAKAAARTSKTKPKPIPEGMHTITPHLVCANAVEAIQFYKKAFGAVAVMAPMLTPDGKVMHASLRVGDSIIMMAEEFPEWGSLGPKALKGTSVTLHLYVPDADASFARAVKAGATVKMPLQDMFWGDRYGTVEDPYGHNWAIATHTRDLTPKELKAAAKAAFSCDPAAAEAPPAA